MRKLTVNVTDEEGVLLEQVVLVAGVNGNPFLDANAASAAIIDLITSHFNQEGEDEEYNKED